MSRRRRRPQSRPAGQPATPPLQPAYPEFSGPGATTPPREQRLPELEAEPPQAAAPDQRPPKPEAEPAQAAAPPDQRRSRRRRKRGGRGRQRSAPVTAPPAEPQREEAAPVAIEPVPEPEPQRPPAPAPPSAPKPKPARGVVVLAIGLPGSGKSSWFRRRGITPLSSDLLRTLLFDSATEQRFQDLVFSSLRSLLRARLVAAMPWNYVDATNLSPKERRGWVKMARDFRYDVHAVFFDVPLEVCQERNRRRLRVVPDDVMHRMAAKLRPPTFEEGFSKITVVKVKATQKEAQAAPDTDQPKTPVDEEPPTEF